MNKIIKQYLTAENIAFALVCAMAVFTYSELMTDTHLIPKQLFTVVATSIAVIILAVKSILGYKLNIDTRAWSGIILLVASSEAAYAIVQFLIYTCFKVDAAVCGSFDNPAGLMALLCLALPFAIYQCRRDAQYRKAAIVLTVLITAAIVVSRSRTGMLITALLLLYLFLRRRKVSLMRRIAITAAVFIILIIGAYFINPASADGRILIWRACWPLICDTPFWGNGSGAFLRLYMDYQAAFLENYPPDSNYAMLADNVLVPFNEYINLYLDYGVIGLLALAGLITLIMTAYRCKPSEEKRAAVTSLVVLAFISLFSYPFTYPFTYVAVIFCLYVIFKDVWIFSIPKLGRISCAVVCMAIAGGVCAKTIRQIDNEYLWGEAYREDDIAKYELLMNEMSGSPQFMYNYAHKVLDSEHFEKALSLANQCNDILSNYDLELMYGDIFTSISEYDNAEIHYITASKMCPNRFIPLYALYKVYTATDDHQKAISIAKEIVDKPIKNNSRLMKSIKRKIKRDLEEYYQPTTKPN